MCFADKSVGTGGGGKDKAFRWLGGRVREDVVRVAERRVRTVLISYQL
jgi:hypothetical protein